MAIDVKRPSVLTAHWKFFKKETQPFDMSAPKSHAEHNGNTRISENGLKVMVIPVLNASGSVSK